jgi:predicted nucleic acid-binding protein
MNTIMQMPVTESANRLPTAFLDTKVLQEILRSEQPSAALLQGAVLAKVRLATNEFALLEALACDEGRQFDRLRERLTVLPVDVSRSLQVLESDSSIRQYLSHSNELLILASALDCDYLVTYDTNFAHVASPRRLKIVTPERFLDALGVRG